MTYTGLSRFTNFAISVAICVTCVVGAKPSQAGTFEEILRSAAKQNGFLPAEATHPDIDENLSTIGKTFFESDAISLNAKISCKDCHLDAFGSGDGIPVAIGIGGKGGGPERLEGGGAIIPRNSLPLWGRGGVGFDVYFWDGKVDFSGDVSVSQFSEQVPSDDPLVVAIHLPPLEIREMLIEDALIRENKREEIDAAHNVYRAIVEKVKLEEIAAVKELSEHFSIASDEVRFHYIAQALAAFIRNKFRLQETRFHQFVFKNGKLTEQELRGGILFYGKGKCSTCHSGPYLSDFQFHSIAFPQLGFGKNGFGVDYGKYNVTLDPNDLYKFRTPPLFNVDKTAPYGHSGSISKVGVAILFHFDPLRLLDSSQMSAFERHEYYKRMSAASSNMLQIGFLDDEEIEDLTTFLGTLSY